MNGPRKGVSPEINQIYAEKLSKMIACKTVWTHDGKYEDRKSVV